MSDILNRVFSYRYETFDDDNCEFEPGQVWKIGSGMFEGTTLLIVHSEFHPQLGKGIHVSVRGALVLEGDEILDGIPHLPFTLEALRASDLVQTGYLSDIPKDWQGMYNDWMDDVGSGDAGLFNLPVEEILEEIMQRLSGILL